MKGIMFIIQQDDLDEPKHQ